MKRTHSRIVKALKAGGVLEAPRDTTTWRLRMPGDPFYGGQVVRSSTVAEMRTLGILDSQARLVPVAQRLAARLAKMAVT